MFVDDVYIVVSSAKRIALEFVRLFGRSLVYKMATACCRRWRLPPDRWGPLAVTGGNLVVACWVSKRADVFRGYI